MSVWLAALSAEVADEEVNLWISVTPEQTERRLQISRTIGERQPEVRASELDQRRTRLQRFLSRFSQSEELMTSSTISRVRELSVAVQLHRETTNHTLETLETSFPLQAFTSAEWSELWESAERFTATLPGIIPEHKLHPLADADTCPMCQSQFDLFARQRMRTLARDWGPTPLRCHPRFRG